MSEPTKKAQEDMESDMASVSKPTVEPTDVNETSKSDDASKQEDTSKHEDEVDDIPTELVPPKPKPDGKALWKKLTIQDIIDSGPVEDEAETYLHRKLEEESQQSRDDLSSNKVLSGLPDEHLDSFAKSSQRSLSSASNRSKKKNKGPGGERLFDMVNMLMSDKGGAYSAKDLQNKPLVAQDYEDSDDEEEYDEDMPTTNHDDLVKNAANLFLRKAQAKKDAKSQKKLQSISEEHPADKKTDEAAARMEEGRKPMKDASGHGRTSTLKKKAGKITKRVGGDFHEFVDFVNDRRGLLWSRIRNALMFVVGPCMGAAFICYYLFDNPPCGTSAECYEDSQRTQLYFPNGTAVTRQYRDDPSQQASVSWFFLFIGVRLVVTAGLALIAQALLIDFCCLMTSIIPRLFGSFLSLLLVQSKGFPFLLLAWGVLNFALLQGSSTFVKHWGYWQDWVGIFNESNQAGTVLENETYKGILISMMVAGASIAVKRYTFGLWMGQRTYSRYVGELQKVMEKAVLIRDVAQLSRRTGPPEGSVKVDLETKSFKSLDETTEGAFTGAYLSGSTQMRINDLLGEFEEPEMLQQKPQQPAIAEIIRFRQSVAFLNTPTPFTPAFGKADSRDICVANSEKLYYRLIKQEGSDILHFNTLAKLCIDDGDGEMDEDKCKQLIKLFRPERDGTLGKLDFVKSIDAVYKEIRLLRAGLANSQKVDHSSETLFHGAFYFVLGCICLAIMGLDPISLFFAVSGFLVGFAFMIGAAVSKMFEGFLLILVRRPYEIGDKINVSSVTTDTPGGGSAGWLVKDMDLFTTTVTYWNGELATYSNGALAAHRIINMNRSDRAFQTFLIKFPSDTDYRKILLFRKCVEQFVKDRPREWMAFNGMRVVRAEIEQGFVEYKVMMTHREKWQNLGAVLDSTGAVQTFSTELCKKMGIEYHAPAMPIDLYLAGKGQANQGNKQSGHRSQPSASALDASQMMSQVAADTDASVDLEDVSQIKGLDAIQKLFK